MGKVKVADNKIIFQRAGEIAVVEPYGKDCIRYRSTPNLNISDESWTLLPPGDSTVAFVEEEHSIVMKNGILSVKVDDWGKMIYYKNEKEIVTTMNEGDIDAKYRHVEGENYRIKIAFQAKKGEHFYGLGQEERDCFDLKGCAIDLVHYNRKSSVPVLYSSQGYGFLWNNPAIGRCEVANNRTVWVADSAYQADYLIFAGEKPADVLSLYADLTGHAPKFPQWASGFWQCKLRYESQEELLEVAREYKRRGIPISAIVADYFHWTEQGEWKFDPTYWPDPEAMCKELKEMGIRLIVSIWPTINPNSENYSKMSDDNMLIRTENGQYGIFPFYGLQTYIDPTNPATREFVWERVKENYYSAGIRDFWLDQAEPEIFPRHFNNLRLHVGNGAQTALLYPYYYSKLFYDGLKKEGEEEIIGLTRCAYPGSQKFGALVWNGDIMSSFDALRMSVKSGLSMAMCGIPWWNSDIGGFHQGDTQSEEFRELLVRWFQFGVFCPVMRLHGARKRIEGEPKRYPNIIEPSGGPNEIWKFGEEHYEYLKELITLRERLRPYIMKYMEIASKTGSPIMRPMFYDYYEDEICYTLEDQYMFGEDILFAPIVEQGQTERSVYLPEGNWIYVGDKKTYSGKQTIQVGAQLHEFIAFVKEGSSVIEVF